MAAKTPALPVKTAQKKKRPDFPCGRSGCFGYGVKLPEMQAIPDLGNQAAEEVAEDHGRPDAQRPHVGAVAEEDH